MLKLALNINYRTQDDQEYTIKERTKENYMVGVRDDGSQRLFKPDGHYAGGKKGMDITRRVGA